MQMNKLGTIIVLSGPSGVGKSTLVGRVREQMPELQFSISCTTRSPRTGEEHGVHYYFLSREEFAERVERGEFVEYADVFAHRYGTLKKEVLDRVRSGSSVILDIDVQGALQIRKAAESDPELKRTSSLSGRLRSKRSKSGCAAGRPTPRSRSGCGWRPRAANFRSGRNTIIWSSTAILMRRPPI